MLRHIVIGIVIVAVLALLVFGAERSVSYVKGTRAIITERVDDSSPMVLEAARVRALMDSQSERILRYEDKTADLQARAELTAQSVTELHKRLSEQKQLLIRIKALLDEKKEAYVIGGHEYTRAEVNADALSRLEDSKRLQEEIEFQQSLLGDLNKAIDQGDKTLVAVRQKQHQLKDQLVRLEARNANADLRNEVATLTNSLASSPLTANSELEHAFQNYARRVAKKERRAGSRLSAASTRHLIDYSSSITTRDAASEISVFMSGEEATGPTRIGPDARPAPSEAVQLGNND